MNRKQLNYRGYTIKEEDGYLVIYKNHNYMPRVDANWKSGLTSAKSKVDKVISMYGR